MYSTAAVNDHLQKQHNKTKCTQVLFGEKIEFAQYFQGKIYVFQKILISITVFLAHVFRPSSKCKFFWQPL